MALGFGKVNPQDWENVKAGGRGDMVDPGDYFATLAEVRQLAPSQAKPLGAFLLTFKTTEENDERWQDKKLVSWMQYHPDPANSPKPEGYASMNDITMSNMAQLIEACNAAPVVDGDGNYDLVESIKKLPEMQPRLVVGVEHETFEGKERQNVGNFRPALGT